MKRQQFSALHLPKSLGCAITVIHNQTISRRSRQQYLWHRNNCVLTWVSVEHQQRVNDFWLCIFDTLRAMERSKCTINRSAAFISKNASDNITSASCNWVPTERQECLWRLGKLHSNVLHSGIPKLSFTQSVISICPCIHLHNDACNLSQIWSFCF